MAEESQENLEENTPKQIIKTLFIGPAGVGKTAFITKYCDDTFISDYIGTVGIDFRVKDLEYEGENIKLQMWDTSGQERYNSITRAYFKGAKGFALVFDANNQDSFDAIPKFYEECKDDEVPAYILVGNKSDLLEEETIAVTKAKKFAADNDLKFFLTSCKTGKNINEVIMAMLELIFAAEEPKEPEPQPKEPEPQPKEPEPKPKEPEPKPKEPEPKPKEPEPKPKPPTQGGLCSCEGGIKELLYHWKVPLIVLAASVSIYVINKYYFN